MSLQLRILAGFCVLLFALLWIRLFHLQILEREEYQEKSEANSIRVVEEIPGRGLICDRNGRVIVENRPSYSLSLIPFEANRNPATTTRLASLLTRSEEELNKDLFQRGKRSYQPVKLARDIDFATFASIRARGLELTGVNIQFDPKRFYPLPVAPHTLGYIGEISESEIQRFPNRKTGDIVGKSGVEQRYEDLLAGHKGYRYLIVNALGQITGELEDKYIPPASSGRFFLTLDLELQKLAEELLANKRGAVVALDPNNGEILAIASSPKYDPELFSGVLRSTDWQMLQDDPGVPLLHRATQSGYPLASTFKMCTLAAALEEGLVKESDHYYCTGSYRLGRIYNCFKRDGHGDISVTESIAQSCDAFYYKLGHKLGVDLLAKYMRIFGFGVPTGIDIENEISGLIPDSKYLDRRYGVGKWSVGLALNIAIGQGESLATPLQLVQYCGILATSGIKCKPHVYKYLQSSEGIIDRYYPETARVPIKSETFLILRQGMFQVLNSEDGTAYWQRSRRWQMAGKTGTAQNPHGEDHALFIGFAPFNDPKIAVAVVLENIGFGSTHAAPIAVKLMSKYLEIIKEPELLQA
ncbi:penicillin-binding protein 2, partial [bacterium]|nr:penicillin-binding protein 2 [bacterium]